MAREVRIKIDIRRPDASLIEEIERIIATPSSDPIILQAQMKTLGMALVAVAQHCADLDKLIQAVAKTGQIHATPPPVTLPRTGPAK